MTVPVRRSVLIYACAFAVAGATPFLLLPVLTRRLSPEQFGEVTSFLVLATLLANVAGLSVHGLVSVRFFKMPRTEFARLASSALAASLGAHLVAALFVIAAYPLLHSALGLPLDLALLAVAAALALSLNLVFLAIFQSAGEPALYLRSRAIQGSIELFACAALLALVGASAGARIHSYVAALVACAVFGLAICQRRGWIAPALDRPHLRTLAAFGVPMLPHIVAGSVLVYLDRIVVSSLLGSASLGVFMAAMQVGMTMTVLIEPLNKALAPWLFEQLAKNDAGVRRMIVQRTYILYAALAGCGVIVAAAAHMLFDVLVGERYLEARALLPWMVAGFVLQGMYYGVVNYLFFAEKTGRLSLMSGFAALVGCAVSYAFTSAYGLAGASAAFCLNNALLFALVWYAAARTVPMPWRLER